MTYANCILMFKEIYKDYNASRPIRVCYARSSRGSLIGFLRSRIGHNLNRGRDSGFQGKMEVRFGI